MSISAPRASVVADATAAASRAGLELRGPHGLSWLLERVADYGDEEPEWRQAARKDRSFDRRREPDPPPLQLLVPETVSFAEGGRGQPQVLFYTDRGGYLRATRKGLRDEAGEVLQAMLVLMRERRKGEAGGLKKAERTTAAYVEEEDHIKSLEGAVQAAERDYGQDAIETIEALRTLAASRAGKRLHAEQAQLLRRAVAAQERRLDRQRGQRRQSWEARARALTGEAELDESDHELVQMLVDLGDALGALMQRQEQVEVLEKALAEAQRGGGPLTVEAARVAVRLADAVAARDGGAGIEVRRRLLSMAHPVLNASWQDAEEAAAEKTQGAQPTLQQHTRHTITGQNLCGPQRDLQRKLDEVRDRIYIATRSREDAMKVMDLNGSGSLSCTEFLDGLKRIGHHISRMEGTELFRDIDTDDKGTIDIDELFPEEEDSELYYAPDKAREVADVVVALSELEAIQENWEQQAGLLQQALEIRENIVGTEGGHDHPDLIGLLVRLGNCYGKRGLISKQRELTCRAVAARRRKDKESDKAEMAALSAGDAPSGLPSDVRRPSFKPKSKMKSKSFLRPGGDRRARAKTGFWRLLLNDGKEKRLSDQEVEDAFRLSVGHKNCWPGRPAAPRLLQMNFWRSGAEGPASAGSAEMTYRYDGLQAYAQPDAVGLEASVRNHFTRHRFLEGEAGRNLASAAPALLSQHLDRNVGLSLVAGQFDFVRDCNGRFWLTDAREVYVSPRADPRRQGLAGVTSGLANFTGPRKLYRYLSEEALQKMKQDELDDFHKHKHEEMVGMMKDHYDRIKEDNGVDKILGRVADKMRDPVIPLLEGTDRKALARVFGNNQASTTPVRNRSAGCKRPPSTVLRPRRGCETSARSVGGRLFPAGAVGVPAAPRSARGSRPRAFGGETPRAHTPRPFSPTSPGSPAAGSASPSGGPPESWRRTPDASVTSGARRVRRESVPFPGSPTAAHEPTYEMAESRCAQELLPGSGPGVNPPGPTLDRVGPTSVQVAGAGLQARLARPTLGCHEVKVPASGAFANWPTQGAGTDIAIAAGAYPSGV